MKKQKTAESTQSKYVLPIFAALCALFGSGAVIGITLLSSPALQWRLITALLPEYAVCFAILFVFILGYGSVYKPVALVTLPAACLACGVRTVFASAPYSRPLVIALVFTVLAQLVKVPSVTTPTNIPTEPLRFWN